MYSTTSLITSYNHGLTWPNHVDDTAARLHLPQLIQGLVVVHRDLSRRRRRRTEAGALAMRALSAASSCICE